MRTSYLPLNNIYKPWTFSGCRATHCRTLTIHHRNTIWQNNKEKLRQTRSGSIDTARRWVV